MPAELPATITIDGVTLDLVVTRKRVRNINARLRGSTLLVSSPPGVPAAELDRVITALARTLLRRKRTRELNGDGELDGLARRIAGRFPDPPRVGTVLLSTAQRSRWGSYSAATGTIRLNAALRHMPAWVLEAVVTHELAHVFHRGHTPAFWTLVRRVCPETDRARAFLAGVSWLAGRWASLPAVERSQLAEAEEDVRADE